RCRRTKTLSRQATGAINARRAQDHCGALPGLQLLFGIQAALGARSDRRRWTLLVDASLATITINTAGADINNMRGRAPQASDHALDARIALALTWRWCKVKQAITARPLRRAVVCIIQVAHQGLRADGAYTLRACRRAHHAGHPFTGRNRARGHPNAGIAAAYNQVVH